MAEEIIIKKGSARLAELGKKLRNASIGGKIIEIPQDRFACPNHGREKMYHSFTPRIQEIECSCNTIYKRV